VALHVRATESPADALLAPIERVCAGLARFPLRGHVPPELERIGVFEFREVHARPYRIIYEIVGRAVHVHAVLDGRRALQDLLARRLLR
jgi:toxin ParE1/3/4